MKPIILGIDPGTTSAYACLDFDGEIVAKDSSYQMPKSKIIEKVIREGIPVIVTSDRKSPPSTVREISSNTGALLFNPETNLSQKRKRTIGFGDNSHEIDAVAAAKNAYKKNIDSIKKLKKKSRRENQKNLGDLALEKFSKSYSEVHRDEEISQQEQSHSEKPEKLQDLKAENGQLKRKVEILQKRVSELEQKKAQSKPVKSEILRLESIVHRYSQENSKLEAEIDNYRQKISSYRKALYEARNGKVLVDCQNSETGPCIVGEESKAEELRKNGVNARTQDELEGNWYEEFFIADELPELKLDEMT